MNSVSSFENLARFIFSKRHFGREKRKVKYAAFLPLNGQTSVFRISNLREEEIWNIGKMLGSKRDGNLHGRGDVSASDVIEIDLSVEPETKDHALHANIVGWPTEDPKQKLLAIKLADKATPHLIKR